MSETIKKRVMLVDAAQSEETRIAIVENNRIEELDYEITQHRNLKGNIYLAKVVRVEPSLQAAFVDFGEKTHGFLPFSEIHPSYFRIPVSDREEIEAELERLNSQGPTEDEEDELKGQEDAAPVEDIEDDPEVKVLTPSNIRDRYKIQEVIENRQVILVQVVKEARGNKGSALTSYLSLAGRYCVLMPNNLRGTGGVSRKINDNKDRKRLREIHKGLDVAKGMGLILRTAGTKKTKVEIKRDYQFLVKSWEEIRDLTLASTAPALVYEEATLVKRYIRDVYGKDIDEVFIEGKEAYKSAKQFIKKLMPSHAKNIQEHKDPTTSIFSSYKIETQIDAMFDTVVSLPSGGYLVIDTTEALVAIDINSGKSTKERNIRETALNTNLEAAEEIARQLKLRDLGGLVVVDFIDMDDPRHNAEVEKRLRSKMNGDRARVQIGKISNFGLLELSRQRLRPSLVDSHFNKCFHCQGTGIVRAKASAARMILRMVGEMNIASKIDEIVITCSPDVALYILNEKRELVVNLEQKHDVRIRFEPSDTCVIGHHAIDLKSEGRRVQEGSIAFKERRDELERDVKSDKSRNQKKNKGRQNQKKKQAQPQGDKTQQQAEKPEEVKSQENAGPEKTGQNKKRRRRPQRNRNRNKGENKEGQQASPEGSAEGQSQAQPQPQQPSQEKKRPFEKGVNQNKPATPPKAQPEKQAPVAKQVEKKPVSKKPAARVEKSASEGSAQEAKSDVAPAKKKKGWWGKLVK